MSLKWIFILLLFMVSALQASDTTYPAFNLNEWPQDIKDNLIKKIPELQNKSFGLEELNQILKKAHRELNFDQANIQTDQKNLYLVGTISSKIEKIEFKNLVDLDETEALEIMSLSLLSASQENKVIAAADKLQNFLRNSGYRKTRVEFSYVTQVNGQRLLLFNVFPGKKTIISKVLIQGLNQKDQLFLEKTFYWNGINEILSEKTFKKMNANLRDYLNQIGYYQVNIPNPQIQFSANEEKAQIIYKLSPPKHKYKIHILGERLFTETYLTDEVLKLDEYFSSEENFGAEIAEKLKAFYLNQGFSRIEIPYYESKTSDTITITFNIQEGSLTKIQRLSIQGNLSRPEKDYIEMFYKNASSKLQDQIFIQDDVDQAAKNFIISLQNEGFVTAKLNRIQVIPDTTDSKFITILLQVEEGVHTQINKIQISGNSIYKTETLLQMMNLNEGQFLNLSQLEVAINKLKLFYADSGYIEFQVKSENKNLITYSENLDKADLLFIVEEGPQIKVGSILIEGNVITHAKLILTELDFKPGDILTPAKIEESLRRLNKTGHFSGTEIYTLEAQTTISERTLIVKVIERNPGIISSGLGLTNENKYTFQGYLGIAYRNIGGWGRGASVRAEGKYNPEYIKFLESKITFGFLEPYLFDSRVRFRLNYTSSRAVTDIRVRKLTQTNQAVWFLEQDITSHVTGIYEILNISNYVDRGIKPEDEILHNYSREDMVISTTGPSLDLDFKDNNLYPTSGHWSRGSLEYSSAKIGNHNVDDFYKLNWQSNIYLPMNEGHSVVWANSYRYGFLKNIGDHTFGVPYDKKGTLLGGRSTIRGFESSDYFPTTQQIGASYKLRDFAEFHLIKSELRFPLGASQDLSGAVFYDGGIVTVDQINFIDPYRDSFGVGIRYNTPVGPLNLEYARKLDKKSYESDGAFHLSVGIF